MLQVSGNIDDKLNFTVNVDLKYKKASQRMFLMRKVKEFCVSFVVPEKMYISLIESVLFLKKYNCLVQATDFSL